MSDNAGADLSEFIYLDAPRVRSLAAQLDIADAWNGTIVDRLSNERLARSLDIALQSRNPLQFDESFDYTKWTPDGFADGQFFRASGVVRLLDFQWLAEALGGLPAVLRKMSKLEMEALRASDEGKRMSKAQLNQRSQENQNAISKVEEFKVDELTDVITRLYGNIVRMKVRTSPAEPNAVLVGAAYTEFFYDTPAVLSQKYGIEINAGWTVLGQLNIPKLTTPPQPIRTGNQMEDSFEQIAMLMNNTFRLANAPAFPTISFTPLAIYRKLGQHTPPLNVEPAIT